jgi:hypothetical protein
MWSVDMNEYTLDIERKFGKMNTTMKVYMRSEDENGNVLCIQTPLNEVMKAVKEEIGSVTFVFTQETFEKRLDDALMTVLKQIGLATKPFASQIQG